MEKEKEKEKERESRRKDYYADEMRGQVPLDGTDIKRERDELSVFLSWWPNDSDHARSVLRPMWPIKRRASLVCTCCEAVLIAIVCLEYGT